MVCEVGATLRWYSSGGAPVLDGFGPDEWSHSGRGQVLAPWPNRLADGRYELDGVRAQAALDEPERHNAIHGLVRWMPWTLQTRHQNQVSLRLQLHPSPGYPFSLLMELDYHVGREGLTVTARAQSLDESSVPFGLGFHPYLTAGTETVDGAILHVPAHHRSTPTTAACRRESFARWTRPSATSPPRASSDPPCSTPASPPSTATPTAAPGPASMRPAAGRGATLWTDEHFPYLMVYTGDTLPEQPQRRRAVAIEPMTCPPNAFRTGKDLVDLQRGPGVVGLLGHRAPVTHPWRAMPSWSPVPRAASARPPHAPSPPWAPACW